MRPSQKNMAARIAKPMEEAYAQNITRRDLIGSSAISAGLAMLPRNALASTASVVSSTTWASWAKKAIYWVIAKASNALYNVAASKEVGSNYVRVNSGSIEYNNGTNGTFSYIDAVAVSSYSGTKGLYLSISAATDFITGLTDTISYICSDPNGDEALSNSGTLGTGGVRAITVANSKQGTWRVKFVCNSNLKWSSSVTIIDMNAPTSASAFGNGDDMVIDIEGGKYYRIPSENKQLGVVPLVDEVAMVPMRVADLYELFWDSSLGEYVYDLAPYRVGDVIYIRDVPDEVTYEPELDRTILAFPTTRGSALWPFDGDLQDILSVGENVSFHFNVVEEHADERYVFTSIDYFKNAEQKLKDKSVGLNVTDYLG